VAIISVMSRKITSTEMLSWNVRRFSHLWTWTTRWWEGDFRLIWSTWGYVRGYPLCGAFFPVGFHEWSTLKLVTCEYLSIALFCAIVISKIL
jgi:hypothetical protein